MTMKLRLTLISCPPAQGADTQRHVAAGRLTLGRGAENDWVLRDQERVLSKNHCVVEFKGGVYVVIDCSTNGVFHNESLEPLGRGNSAVLADGDRLRFGAFVVKVQFVADDPPPAAADPFLAVLRETSERPPPAVLPIDDDLFAPSLRPAGPVAFTSIPDDDDFLGELTAPRPPLAPAVAEAAWRRDNPVWNPPADRDDAAGVEQAWRDPVAVAPATSAIPDDWDDDGGIEGGGIESGEIESASPPCFAAAFPPPPPAPSPPSLVAPGLEDGEALPRLARQAQAAAAALDAVLPGGDDPERQVSLHMRALLAAARRALAEAGLPVDRLEEAYRQELGEGTTR